jgi:hypothetical protein
VVIDFSSFVAGDTLILTNNPTSLSEVPEFCFSHLVMAFVVDGAEPAGEPFDADYRSNSSTLGDLTIAEVIYTGDGPKCQN